MTEYYLPTRYGTAEFVEKKSRFIGEIWPVSTEEEARQRVADVKKNITMPVTAAGASCCGTERSDTQTMENRREQQDSPCWRCFPGRGSPIASA